MDNMQSILIKARTTTVLLTVFMVLCPPPVLHSFFMGIRHAHAATVLQCNDNIDNDGDGLIDLFDPGCTEFLDDNEGDELPEASIVIADCAAYSDTVVFGEHYYMQTKAVYTWEEGAELAAGLGGYLVIPDTADENRFLLTNGWVNSWIGIYDPEMSQDWCYPDTGTCPVRSDRFRTVLGDYLPYQNWAPGQPDNSLVEQDIIRGVAKVSPLGESWVIMGSNGTWDDYGNHADGYRDPAMMKAIIEFNERTSCYYIGREAPKLPFDGAICERSTVDDQVGGMGSIDLTQTNMWECLSDDRGTMYCPEDLTPCSQHTETSAGNIDTRRAEHLQAASCTESGCTCPEGYRLHIFGNVCGKNYTYQVATCPGLSSSPYGISWQIKEPGGNCGGPENCTYSFPEDNCTRTTYSCDVQPHNNPVCARINGRYMCSSHPCYDPIDPTEGDVTEYGSPVGTNDKPDDAWNRETGECDGSLYIFNGEDSRCTSFDAIYSMVAIAIAVGCGIGAAFSGGTTLLTLVMIAATMGASGIGSLIVDWCCQKSMAAMSMLPCPAEQRQLTEKREEGLCYEIGEYCSRDVALLGCIQKKRSYCCFQTKLARIFHNEARGLLSKSDVSWRGTPEEPRCRGFTPLEFASIPMEEIDLSEFELEIELKADDGLKDDIKDRFDEYYNAGGITDIDI